MASSQLARVEGLVNLLAYGWWTYAGLEAMMSLTGLLFARMFLGMKMNESWGGPFWMGSHAPMLLLKLAWLPGVVRLALAALSGYGLRRKASWGRWTAIVSGIVSLLHPILGAVMGVWTLVVLLNRQIAAAYNEMAKG